MKPKPDDNAPTLFPEARKAKGARTGAPPKKPAARRKVAPRPPAAVPAAVPAPLAPPAASVLAIIARAAADPACQPEKMRALLDMQKEIRLEEARIAFIEAFVALQGELPTIRRDGTLDQGETKRGARGVKARYATFENINKTVKPILRQRGFALSFEPDLLGGDNPDGRIIMRGHLTHAAGHRESCAIPLPLETSGGKNNVQGIGSSISYGKRYAAISLLNIISEAPEDRDDDARSVVAKITAEQAQDLEAKVDSACIGAAKFCEVYRIAKIADLPAGQLPEALERIASFVEKVR